MTGFLGRLYYNDSQLWQVTVIDCLRIVPFLARPQASSLPLWRMTKEEFMFTPWPALKDVYLTNKSVNLSLMLRPTVSQPVCLRIKHPSGAYDQIFITVRQLRVCWCGAFSLTRGGVCRLHLLLSLVSAVILGSESHGIRDHILLSQIRDFLFVASNHSQGYLGDIRPRFHTGLVTCIIF
jgi:hypothetical protein